MATQILFCFMILSLIVASTKEQASGIESRKIGSGVDDTKEYYKELLSGLQNALQQLQPFSGESVIQEQLQQLQQALSSGSGFQEQLQQLQQALSSGSGFQEQLQQLKSLSGGSEFQEQLQQLQQMFINGTGFQEQLIQHLQAVSGRSWVYMFFSIFINVSIFVIVIFTVGVVYYR
jgi:superoxide dismutase